MKLIWIVVVASWATFVSGQCTPNPCPPNELCSVVNGNKFCTCPNSNGLFGFYDAERDYGACWPVSISTQEDCESMDYDVYIINNNSSILHMTSALFTDGDKATGYLTPQALDGQMMLIVFACMKKLISMTPSCYTGVGGGCNKLAGVSYTYHDNNTNSLRMDLVGNLADFSDGPDDTIEWGLPPIYPKIGALAFFSTSASQLMFGFGELSFQAVPPPPFSSSNAASSSSEALSSSSMTLSSAAPWSSASDVSSSSSSSSPADLSSVSSSVDLASSVNNSLSASSSASSDSSSPTSASSSIIPVTTSSSAPTVSSSAVASPQSNFSSPPPLISNTASSAGISSSARQRFAPPILDHSPFADGAVFDSPDPAVSPQNRAGLFSRQVGGETETDKWPSPIVDESDEVDVLASTAMLTGGTTYFTPEIKPPEADSTGSSSADVWHLAETTTTISTGGETDVNWQFQKRKTTEEDVQMLSPEMVEDKSKASNLKHKYIRGVLAP